MPPAAPLPRPSVEPWPLRGSDVCTSAQRRLAGVGRRPAGVPAHCLHLIGSGWVRDSEVGTAGRGVRAAGRLMVSWPASELGMGQPNDKGPGCRTRAFLRAKLENWAATSR